ncbi:hypothetical protein N3K66_003972 [Trichothecium roseum]|uniref:Uncharacterized protein n=1 Tax=Trichothecium roseum TaxID=47278 RepID=A0ACC0V6P7_9HYPO|nr:hypothetical protein N3K66_003972 [Trichothecium roseum]
MLPDLTPRDPHSLWYTPLRGPGQLPNPLDQNHHNAQADAAGGHHNNGGASGAHQSRQRAMMVERTALSRLAADEVYLRHRKANVQNFGSGWLKPPGVSKTLHQMREEKRELEEHAEAMRREQLAQELAEAEASGGGDGGDAGGLADGDPESGMDDVQLDGAQDLDDDIPEAGDADFGYGDDDDDEEEDGDDDEEDEDGEDSDEDGEITREERQNDLMAARMRLTDDAFREALVRGEPEGDDMYGGEEELEEEDRGHLLDEEDLGPDEGDHQDGMGDMDADLDDDIPEAGDEDCGYEHTDSEAELSSSSSNSNSGEEEEEGSSENNSEDINDESRVVAGGNDDSEEEGEEDTTRHSLDIGFAPRAGALGPPGSPTGQLRGMMMRQHAPRHSMDLSGLLSNDESSFMDSSPIRRARH